MEINVLRQGTRDILEINDARIVYRNFRGEGSKFNRVGDRNFSIVIPTEEIKDMLVELGFNVKIKAPREDGEMPFMHLPVKVKYSDDPNDVDENGNRKGPSAYLTSGANMVALTDKTIACLDDIEIASVNLDVRSYDWTMPNGQSGRSAYLQGINVFQRIDRFAESYNNR